MILLNTKCYGILRDGETRQPVYGIKEKEVTYKYSFNTDLSLRRTILYSQGSDRACYDSLTF